MATDPENAIQAEATQVMWKVRELTGAGGGWHGHSFDRKNRLNLWAGPGCRGSGLLTVSIDEFYPDGEFASMNLIRFEIAGEAAVDFAQCLGSGHAAKAVNEKGHTLSFDGRALVVQQAQGEWRGHPSKLIPVQKVFDLPVSDQGEIAREVLALLTGSAGG